MVICCKLLLSTFPSFPSTGKRHYGNLSLSVSGHVFSLHTETKDVCEQEKKLEGILTNLSSSSSYPVFFVPVAFPTICYWAHIQNAFKMQCFFYNETVSYQAIVNNLYHLFWLLVNPSY